MYTITEADRDGKPERVYHRAGVIDGRKDEKYQWTHPYSERAQCVACTGGIIPPEVRKAGSNA